MSLVEIFNVDHSLEVKFAYAIDDTTLVTYELPGPYLAVIATSNFGILSDGFVSLAPSEATLASNTIQVGRLLVSTVWFKLYVNLPFGCAFEINSIQYVNESLAISNKILSLVNRLGTFGSLRSF
eukprot:NODE_217_length_14216_cov_0.430545.p8 type:complete len:125 gc:universal NODE_217_length_14216_cov_0.430545:13184-12810(-)